MIQIDIDMPKNCMCCPFSSVGTDFYYCHCPGVEERAYDFKQAESIPDDCPLHEVNTDSDTISRQATIEALEKSRFPGAPYIDRGILIALREIKKLSSAQPERETAKFIRWMEIKKTDEYISYTPHCKCSKCGTEFLIETIKYCYMCGARMEENNEGD